MWPGPQNMRGLCCFPSLSTKKPNMALLSDQVSVLSTNNSDSFLEKLAHIDQRERERQEHREQDSSQSNQAKSEEIVLLEKQGRCSQKLRNNVTGNLAQVTQTVGQNMTDISNIGGNNLKQIPKIVTSLSQNYNMSQGGTIPLPPRLKERGTSLPPSALPRPPRGLKPPRKIEYDRLSDSELKARSQTPPKISSQSPYSSATLKRNELSRRDYHSPSKNYMEMKEALSFPKSHFTLKRKDYGSMNKTEFSKPDFTSTKNYQRLEDTSKGNKMSPEPNGYKRSLLPSVRKYSPGISQGGKNSRDSVNSNESNNSNNSNLRRSPIHLKVEPNCQQVLSRTPSKYTAMSQHEKTFLSRQQPQMQPQTKSNAILQAPNSPNVMRTAASLPPKPTDNKNIRRGSSVTRGENRYRIQF